MIPKIIHYCWLSDNPIPPTLQEYVKSWENFLPDYDFMLWNFDRFDKCSSVWVKEAFENKKYAFAADYIRLYAVYNYGGFYLDMDVEVLKSFNDFLNLKSAICWQDGQDGFEAACFGAEMGSSWIKECLDYYQNRHFILPDGKMDIRPLPNIMEETLRSNGYLIENAFSIKECLNNENEKTITILPNVFFSPKSYKTGVTTKTDQTYSIHHFAASWVNKYDNLPWYAKIWNFLHLPDTDILKKLHLKQHFLK